MKTITLSLGLVAMIDDDDFNLINQFKWFARKARNGYYAATWVGPWRERKLLDMQNMLVKKPEGEFVVDHIDRNGLNNQRDNLRLCTKAQNCYNRTPSGKSKYLGVSPVERATGTVWRAFIAVNKVNKYLGIFKTEDEAAAAYNAAAIEFHGEFAYLNTIPQSRIAIAEYDSSVGAIIITTSNI